MYSTYNLRGCPIRSETDVVGELWGSVIDRHTWDITHIVVETGGWFDEQCVLISRPALGSAIADNETIQVSLRIKPEATGCGQEVVDPTASPFVTRLKSCVESPRGWALARPLPLYAFPMPVVNSFYVKDQPSSGHDDTRPYSCRDLIGCVLRGEDGSRIGRIDDLLLDDCDWRIRYLILSTRRLLPGRKVLLPTPWVNHEVDNDSTFTVDLPAALVREGPAYAPRLPIDGDCEQELFAYYGRKPCWEQPRQKGDAVR